MSVSTKQIKKLLNEVQNVAQPCTDTILRINQFSKPIGIGSCIYIQKPNDGAIIGVTCNHVLKENEKYFMGAKRGDDPKIPNIPLNVSERMVIKRIPEIDIAFLDTEEFDFTATQKSSINILESSSITLELLSRNINNVIVIFGWPKLLSDICENELGEYRGLLVSYSALGLLSKVKEDCIIGDFTEKESFYVNSDVIPINVNLEPTGGSRDLSGMSGSGLWIKTDDGILLAGILSAPEEATESIHLIRFVPIWKVLSALKEL